MKKIILLTFSILFVYSLSAQLFFTENFEAGPSTYAPDANQICNGSDYFARTDGSSTNANGTLDYSGFQGSFYWAGESHDDIIDGNPGTCNPGAGSPTKQLVFNPIDISSLTQNAIELSALLGGNEVSNAFEAGDFVSISYSFDNVTFTPLLSFTPVENVPSPGFDQLCLDGMSTDCIGQVMKLYTAVFLKGSNTTLYINVTAGNDSSSEEWAIDNITLTNITFLPVELIDFTAKPMDQGVMLDWSTASEQDNDYFAIERSFDGQRFKEIGKVAGAGSSYTAVDYNFFDSNPPALASSLYYRLRQVDYDGKFEYSPIEVIDREISGDGIQLWPNPTNSELNISLTSSMSEQPVRVEIFDINGRLLRVADFDQVGDNMSLNVSELTEGIYLIKIGSEQFSQTKRFIKQ